MLRVFCSDFYSIVGSYYTNHDLFWRFLTPSIITTQLHLETSK